MTKQMTMMLPKVNENATRDMVKQAFETYHEYKATLKTMTAANFSILRGCSGPSTAKIAQYPTNDADSIRGSSKRRTALQEMSMVAERLIAQEAQIRQRQEQIETMQQFVDAIENVVNTLPDNEREVMKRTLMEVKEARHKDSVIWPQMNMRKNVFYKHKEKAMLRIAFALCIEVYESGEGHVA